MAKAAELVAAIERRDWEAALPLVHTAKNSLGEAALLDPFRVPVEVRCQVKGQAPWQVKLKTRAERCTGIYHPASELVNGMPCWKKIGSDKDGDGQVWLCFTSNGPGHERYMIQHVRVRGQSKGYARCKLSHSGSPASEVVVAAAAAAAAGGGEGGSSSSGGAAGGAGDGADGGGDGAGGGGGGGGGRPQPTTPTGLVVPAPHQVRLWQVHDGIDWSVCEDFVVVSVLPIPLLVALELAAPTPCCRLSSVGTVAAADNEASSSSSSSSSSLSSSSPSSSLSSSSVSVFERVPASVLDLFVAPCLLDVDVARALCASRGTCSVLAGSMSSRAQWRVVAAVLEQDPKAAEQKMRDGSLPRDVACAKGAPLALLDALVDRTPYASLAEATTRAAHCVHLDRIIEASPLAMALRRLGFGPNETGRLMADNSLGLSSEKDLVHLRYDELVRAGVTAVNARKAMGQLQALRAIEQGEVSGGFDGFHDMGGFDYSGSDGFHANDYEDRDSYRSHQWRRRQRHQQQQQQQRLLHSPGADDDDQDYYYNGKQDRGAASSPPLQQRQQQQRQRQQQQQQQQQRRRSYGEGTDLEPSANSPAEDETTSSDTGSATGVRTINAVGSDSSAVACLEERLLRTVAEAAEREAALRESVQALAGALGQAVTMAARSEERVARLAEVVEGLVLAAKPSAKPPAKRLEGGGGAVASDER